MSSKRAVKAPTSVEAGQIYRVPRPGKPARHLRIVKVTGLSRHQPFAFYREVTRTGRKKPGVSIRHFLTWTGREWSMAPRFELVAP